MFRKKTTLILLLFFIVSNKSIANTVNGYLYFNVGYCNNCIYILKSYNNLKNKPTILFEDNLDKEQIEQTLFDFKLTNAKYIQNSKMLSIIKSRNYNGPTVCFIDSISSKIFLEMPYENYVHLNNKIAVTAKGIKVLNSPVKNKIAFNKIIKQKNNIYILNELYNDKIYSVNLSNYSQDSIELSIKDIRKMLLSYKETKGYANKMLEQYKQMHLDLYIRLGKFNEVLTATDTSIISIAMLSYFDPYNSTAIGVHHQPFIFEMSTNNKKYIKYNEMNVYNVDSEYVYENYSPDCFNLFKEGKEISFSSIKIDTTANERLGIAIMVENGNNYTLKEFKKIAFNSDMKDFDGNKLTLNEFPIYIYNKNFLFFTYSDFVYNLKTDKWFQLPISIIDTLVEGKRAISNIIIQSVKLLSENKAEVIYRINKSFVNMQIDLTSNKIIERNIHNTSDGVNSNIIFDNGLYYFIDKKGCLHIN